MEILYPFVVFIFGAIVGSFLNVVVLRYNTGRPILTGRSVCFSCSATLRWFELVPILSFIVLKGRCGQCGSRLSWQYLGVEVITAALFTLIFINLGWSQELFFSWIMLGLGIAITTYDMRHKIIPDGLVYALISVSFIWILSRGTITDVLVGLGVFLFFTLIWAISRGRWIGLGDAKLALGLVWFLGAREGLSGVIIAFWVGAFVGLSLLCLWRQKLTIKSELPFAPFLFFGALVAMIFEIQLII